jgi:2-keto-4-pentenoate hydratase/2-oxohepta-3-ene-1,7-dioic acid hydratase in catechol pathway
MKIVRFEADGKIKFGILTGQSIRLIQGKPFGKIKLTDNRYQLGRVRLLAPCVPSKIIALGLNYRSHAAEVKANLPSVPLIFLKPSTAVIGPEDSIVYPPSSIRVDYEGELGVVIKKPAWGVVKEKALDYILGYTCFNDVTARDHQGSDGQWTRAKGFDTFAPLGPCIETELDLGNVVIETYLNGELKQKGITRDLIYSVPELVSFISNVMTLLPGDIIATGTPSGIGPMTPGDTVEIRIESIGTLRNYVVRG